MNGWWERKKNLDVLDAIFSTEQAVKIHGDNDIHRETDQHRKGYCNYTIDDGTRRTALDVQRTRSLSTTLTSCHCVFRTENLEASISRVHYCSMYMLYWGIYQA